MKVKTTMNLRSQTKRTTKPVQIKKTRKSSSPKCKSIVPIIKDCEEIETNFDAQSTFHINDFVI